MCKYIHFSSKWLSDGIGDSYEQWACKDRRIPLKSATSVFIESPTGTGKTSFILDKLFPYAAKKGRNILYLGNRAALKAQTEYATEHRLIEGTMELQRGYAQELRSAKLFYYPGTNYSITILNYQAFIGFSGQYLNGNNPFYYIIFDEAHFFLEDSLFNPMTAMILDKLMESFSNSVLVFMSATIAESAGMLLNALRAHRDLHPQQMVYQALREEDVIIYQNLIVPRNYNTRFFNRQADIITEIVNTPPDEKWLIFATSKQSAAKMAEDIKMKTGSSVSLLSADKKKGHLWDTLINDSHYKKRVLITTKVLDNSVNILDPLVKHVVLPFCDQVDFLQMLGRKRADEGEHVNLYIAVPTIQTINSQLHRVSEMKAALDEVIQLYSAIQIIVISANTIEQQALGGPSSNAGPWRKGLQYYYGRLTKILQKHWLEGRTHINNLFYLNGNRNLVPNYLAYEKLQRLELFYSELKKNAANPDYWQTMALSWLQHSNSRHEHLSMESHETLEDFLKSHMNAPVYEMQQQAFYNEFQYRYKQRCYELYGANKTELKTALGIRKGKTQRKATMNKSLAMLNLPYEIKKEQHCWVVREKPV